MKIFHGKVFRFAQMPVAGDVAETVNSAKIGIRSANRIGSRFGRLGSVSARIRSKIEFHWNISICGNRRNLLVRKAISSMKPRFGLRPPRGACKYEPMNPRSQIVLWPRVLSFSGLPRPVVDLFEAVGDG